MNKILLQEMTWEDVRDYLKENDIIVIPIGSTEQHGPHLPLGCDSYAAIGLAEDAAKEAGVVIAPHIWYGDSPHHLGFPGTISLRSETLIELMKDVYESLIRHGFRKIVTINGHRGANIPALKIAIERTKEKHPDIFIAIVDPFEMGKTVAREIRESSPGEIFHAEEIETSHMLYLHSNLVHMEKAKREFAGFPSKYIIEDPFIPADKVTTAFSAEEEARMTKSGIIGDPTKASRGKGEKFHKKMVKSIVEFINELKTLRLPLYQG